MTYISEKYQRGPLLPYLRNTYQKFVFEGRSYSIPIDILAVDGDELVAIELKSRNHKRGLAQAKRNTAFADYSYLSVWEDQVTDFLLERVNETEIGLIAVDQEVNILKESSKLDPNKFAKEATMGVFE